MLGLKALWNELSRLWHENGHQLYYYNAVLNSLKIDDLFVALCSGTSTMKCCTVLSSPIEKV